MPPKAWAADARVINVLYITSEVEASESTFLQIPLTPVGYDEKQCLPPWLVILLEARQREVQHLLTNLDGPDHKAIEESLCGVFSPLGGTEHLWDTVDGATEWATERITELNDAPKLYALFEALGFCDPDEDDPPQENDPGDWYDNEGHDELVYDRIRDRFLELMIPGELSKRALTRRQLLKMNVEYHTCPYPIATVVIGENNWANGE